MPRVLILSLSHSFFFSLTAKLTIEELRGLS
jgi:hypothetical protein